MINSGKKSENTWLFLRRSRACGRAIKFSAWGREMFDEKTILRVHRLLSECHELQGLAQFESFIRNRIKRSCHTRLRYAVSVK